MAQFPDAPKKQSAIIEHMVDGYALHEIITDADGEPVDYRFLDINPAFESMTGLSRDIVGRTVMEILPGTEAVWIEKYGHVARTGTPLSFEQRSANIGKYFKVNAYSPEPGKFACLFIDISDQVLAAEKLARSEAMLRALLNNSRDIYLALDVNFCVITANATAVEYLEKMLGFHPLPGACLLDAVPKELAETWKERYTKALAGEDVFFHDTWEDGGDRYDSDVSIRPLFVNDRVEGITIASRDMTEYFRNRDEIQHLLDEKHILLTEVHHRIKNNIYTVRSMLEIQAMSTENEAAADIINAAQMKLGSMMNLYDKLYRGEDFRHVSMKDLLHSLLEDLLKGLPVNVHTTTGIEELSLDAETASSLGIIVNELITNSLKYAFTIDRDNQLNLVLRPEGDRLKMEYSDNGSGYSLAEQAPGFGMELLKAFTEKLGGTYRLSSSSAGSVCELEIPLPS